VPSDELRSDDPGGVDTVGDANADAEAARALARGDTVGRYLITAALGHGGMGVVYAAYDPELDRRLAIKVLHPHARGSLGSSSGQQRMLREARAMAKLSHPNVVVVHDVGTVDRSVFVAMEYIEGCTLARWLEQSRRSWQEILAVFLAAGEGLAAAHRAGLVHRDFKPDNVMIADERPLAQASGRVVVMDFGLARSTVDADDHATGRAPVGEADTRLTQTGALLGTPAYMAPEQHLGADTGAHSDQFSFCVALHEALWGTRPFVGDTITALAMAVTSGARVEPDDHRGVPMRIHRAIVRGLAVDPAARWPGMRELLGELARDPARRRRRVLAIASVPVLALAGAFALDRIGEAPAVALCSGGEDRLAEVWDPARRQAIAAAMLATGLGHADDTRRRVELAVDAFADEWSAEFRDACEATNLRAVQSPELMDRRMSCLQRRLGELDAMLGELEHPSPAMIDRAVTGVARTTELSACSDTDRLLADTASPTDPEHRALVEAVQAQLAISLAQRTAGRAQESLATVTGALTQLDAHDWPSLRAELMFAKAQNQSILGDIAGAERTMTDGYWIARGSGNDRAAAELAAELLGTIAETRPQEAVLWEQQARADVERLGDDGEPRARLLDTLGLRATRLYQLDSAEQLHREALAIWIRIGGEQSIDVAVAEHGLGNVEFMRRRDDEAERHYRRALEIWRVRMGEGHPQLADVHVMLGNIAHRAGDLERAEREFEITLALLEAAYGDSHPDLGGALNGLALVYADRGEHERALATHLRVLAIELPADGPDHPQIATTEHNAAVSLAALGRHAEALERHRRGLSIRERALGAEHPQVSESLENVARELLALDRPAEAIAPLERALPIVVAAEGPPKFLADLQLMLARAQWGAGDPRRAGDALLAARRELARVDVADPDRDALTARVDAVARELASRRR
jgi:eukaryotic-like serine/threonine-protein kinase